MIVSTKKIGAVTVCHGKLGGGDNWASEASPTLGCSIEISRDIYIYVHVSVVVQKA